MATSAQKRWIFQARMEALRSIEPRGGPLRQSRKTLRLGTGLAEVLGEPSFPVRIVVSVAFGVGEGVPGLSWRLGVWTFLRPVWVAGTLLRDPPSRGPECSGNAMPDA